MAGPTQDALSVLEDAVGNIDEFVRKELGYETLEDLHDGLMGLQVDSVAAAIYQIGQGKGVIIADQTGIGKGRQAAAIIRWAKRTGRVPVFVSVKPSLFTDMYGDLADIGSNDIAPFILNKDESIKGSDDEPLFANKPAGHRRMLERIVATRELPNGRNALFMTYSQINVDNLQRQVVNALAQNAVFVLDESHNAGGDSNTGDFIKSVLEVGQGVTYLSATYAKRPDNMPVYFKTDIGEASASDETLQSAMDAGGLPLQTVVANNLVRAGQMFRRERSYDGVSIVTRADTAHRDEHVALSDRTTEALRAIVAADRQFHDGYVKELQKQLAAQGEGVQDIAGNQVQESVNHTEFSSVVHNFVRQMLLGLKAQEAADEAIAAIKRGEKPLIALESTMGSFLSEYAAANGIKPGGPLGKFDYRTVLSRALARSRFFVRVMPTGDKVRQEVKLEQLDDKTREAYRLAQEVIDALELTIPVSPIDWMRHKIGQAGYSVMEITGREQAVDYSNEKKPVLTSVDTLEHKDKVRTRNMFNGGELDAIILNVAGSTGISLHASERFRDQRKRHMVIAQAAQDINVFMQMLGRIHRTGQVVLPGYTILNVDLPAEKRPTALLSKKMKSLNANTSSNTESATSVQAFDMLNKYGDQVIGQYLSENMELSRDLGIEEPMSGETPLEDIARKATGRLALMPVSVQESFYADVEQQYSDLIEYLNRTNQNDLEPRTFDFDAKPLKEAVLFEGQNKESPFGQDAIYGEYSIKAQGKPMTPNEINALLVEHLGGKKPMEHAEALLASVRPGHEAAIERTQSEVMKVAVREAGRQVADFVREHPVGSRWRVEINGEVYNAVITNLRSTHRAGPGNPMTPSKVQVTIAVNGSLRSAAMGMNQFKLIEVAALRGEPVSMLFAEKPSDERETAKIVTGNLLGAYGNLPNVRGTIIAFTREDGTIDQGILLPKKFNFDKDVPKDYRLPDATSALKFLQNGTNGDLARFGIMSRDGSVRAIPYRGGVTIQVPKSKARGGKFFLDPVLRENLGDFVSTGNLMRASTDDPAAAERAIAQTMKKVALYAVPSMADEARAIVGGDMALSVQEDFADTEFIPMPTVLEAGPVRKDDAAAVARIQQNMRANGMTTLELEALPRPRQPADDAIELTKQRYWAAKMIETIFGRRLVWFSANQEFANGIHSQLYPDALFVNEKLTRPIMAVLGHEMLHALKRDHPELYNRLSDRLRGLLNDTSPYAILLNAKRKARGLPPLTFDAIREELIADIVGDNFTDPRFWREMVRGQNPSVFGRILRAVRDFFDAVIAKLKNERPYGTDKYLSDIVAAREAVVQAMSAYATSEKATTNVQAMEADFSLSADTGAFYSELARQVGDAPIKAAQPAAWKQYIRSRVGKGVKADEIEWSGVEQWLDLQPGRVGKEAVLEYLAANGVQVTETVLENTKRPNQFVVRNNDTDGRIGSFDTRAEAEDFMRNGRRAAEFAEGNFAVVEIDGGTDRQTKYGKYTLPGGTNYREVLLTLPAKDTITTRQVPVPAGWGDTEGGNVGVERTGDTGADYRSGHWDQPNILAHIRLNDRVDSEGRRVLFVEEVQGDWPQAMRKQHDAIAKAVDSDFNGIVSRMKAAGVLAVECD